jgi:protein phosphatase
LASEEDIANVSIKRVPLWNDKKEITGPFDIIGDIHGCYDELGQLLSDLGYVPSGKSTSPPMDGPIYSHPQGRMAVFLGDVVDRGPKILESLKLVYNMVTSGNAMCVPGNHDTKLLRKLRGKNVQMTHGLAESVNEIESLSEQVREAFQKTALDFIDSLISHYVFDNGKLVVAHAGVKQDMQGRASGKVRAFCLYGETSGETDEFGLPIRHNWAAEYRGSATVVYGHTPVLEPEWLNRTINIDTGCVFGGKLTALRYPEKEIISVPAAKIYCEPIRPLAPNGGAVTELSVQQQYDDVLDAEDVMGKRFVTTRLRSNVTIREEHSTAALEVMSRFAANPKWLIYLPPTMSPSETSRKEGFLEYPDDAFAYYRSVNTTQVICEEKHMGSRAVVIVCKNEAAATRHFGTENEGIGIIYTRTGRRFFSDIGVEQEFLDRIRRAMTKADFWTEFNTQWACLDCELMPWSEKAQDLLKTQYAAVGASATAALSDAINVLRTTVIREDLEKDFTLPEKSSAMEFNPQRVLDQFERRKNAISKYIRSYRQYCWPVNSIEDLKVAPFHLLATEGRVHIDKDHQWHMQGLNNICQADTRVMLSTGYKIINLADEDSIHDGIKWWEELTASGGEGMVVKPLAFIARGKKGLVQPALKCRGREYLRIIYGAEYALNNNLDRLRSRALGKKRSLALREFALGVEALERFVRKEPLRRVHECVFGVLALESEPVDPRL